MAVGCTFQWGSCSATFPEGETASLFGEGLRLFASGFSSVSAISWHMLGCSVSPLRGAVSLGWWESSGSNGAVAHMADQGVGDAAAPGCAWGPWRETRFPCTQQPPECVCWLCWRRDQPAHLSSNAVGKGRYFPVLPTPLTPTATYLGVAPPSSPRSQG